MNKMINMGKSILLENQRTVENIILWKIVLRIVKIVMHQAKNIKLKYKYNKMKK